MHAALATGGVSTDERLMRLERLDLTNIKRKLMEPYPEGKGWTAQQCDEVEKWYKRYLAVIIKYPDARAVPNMPIDMFWHQHILDTAAYREDCAQVMGYFLDHYPYFGLNGDADQRDICFDETNAIYRSMYGEDCKDMASGRKLTLATMAAPCGGESGCGTGGNGGTCCNLKAVTCGTGCHGGNCGSGSGDGQRAEAMYAVADVGVNCNSGGSGTGCGQGCSRGSKCPIPADFGPVTVPA